ncbi:hypothetical protein [Dysgonomonas sp. ZJ279]|uniref:hypothetical protein n=1 Tax=Dysgonomonas sp. ZJ279 TaxID=2709796 RepID=UPI0013EC0E03|nr:hypothetical protein [Dysgonomonas sp. ZJ279]
MLSETYINNKSLWANYSARLIDDSFDNLDMHPPIKAYTSNDLRGHDGVQIFLNNPRVNKRQVILTFAITCNSRKELRAKKQALEAELSKGLILLKVVPNRTTYKLILDEESTFTLSSSLSSCTLTVRFTEPNPKDRIKL